MVCNAEPCQPEDCIYQTACTAEGTVPPQRQHVQRGHHSAQTAERSAPAIRTRSAVGRATARPPARAPLRSTPEAAPWMRAGFLYAAGRAPGCRAPCQRCARGLQPGCWVPTRRGPLKGRPQIGCPRLEQPARISWTSDLQARQAGLFLPHGCAPEQGCLYKNHPTVGRELQRPPGEVAREAEMCERWALGNWGTCTAHAVLLRSAGWTGPAGCAHAHCHPPLSVTLQGVRMLSVAMCRGPHAEPAEDAA